MLKKSKSFSQKGNAVFEILPVLLLFVLLINFMLGFFGIVHSGILNSIAARNYTFETFRNRADLNYFRDIQMSQADLQDGYRSLYNYRFHGIISENAASTDDWKATKRSVKFSDIGATGATENPGLHTAVNGVNAIRSQDTTRVSEQVKNLTPDSAYEDFNRVWVRTVYGICLTCGCGGSSDSKCTM